MVTTLLLKTCYSGFCRGFLAELFHFLGVVGATILACKFHPVLSGFISPWLSIVDPAVLDVASFLFLLLSAFALIRAVSVRLAAHITWERLNWIMQSLGLLIGGIRGLWWAGLGLLMLLATDLPYLAESIEQRSLVSPTLVMMTRQTLVRVVDWAPGPGTPDVLVPSLHPRIR